MLGREVYRDVKHYQINEEWAWESPLGSLLFREFVNSINDPTSITKNIINAIHSDSKAATTVGIANIAVQE